MIPSPADWRLKTCLGFAAGTTVLQLILVLLGSWGIYIPILNQLTGFIFVTFVPGILLLRILRLHHINPVEAIAYAAGLGLACMMLCGTFINLVLPLTGIAHPITPLPVAVSLSVLYLLLMVGAYRRDSQFQPNGAPSRIKININMLLLLLVVLLMVILGVLALDKTGSNIILIICIFSVALVFCLGTLRWLISYDAYPIAIFTISLVLLYQTTLISPFLIGSDIYLEYLFYQLTAQSGIWSYGLPGTINACLSIVIAVPVYAQMMHVDGVWVFKAVYPILFSLVPLVMYRFIRIQTGRLPAFLAVFFFMSMPTFSLELISLGRQQFAELFFVLLILLLVERKIGNPAKMAMLITFALGVTVSHYTFGFINFVYMGTLILMVVILRNRLFLNVWARITAKTGGLPSQLRNPNPDGLTVRLLSIAFIIISALSFIWYALVAAGSNLLFFSGTLVLLMQKLGLNIQYMASPTGNISHYLLAGQGDFIISAALGLDFSQVSLPGRIFRIIQYITQILIVIGCIRLIIKPSGLNFRREYIAFSFVSSLILAACIMVPWFSNILNVTRWYHIALITLSPFLIIGAQSIWELALWAGQKLRGVAFKSNLPGDRRYLNYLALVVLLPYFIFTSGLVFEFGSQRDTNIIDTPYSIALSGNRLDLTGIFNRRDGDAAHWLAGHTSDNATVNTDVHASKIILFRDYPPRLNINHIDRKDNPLKEGYVFLTTWNVEKNELTFTNSGRPGMREHLAIRAVPGLADALQSGNRIYVNNGSQVYFQY